MTVRVRVERSEETVHVRAATMEVIPVQPVEEEKVIEEGTVNTRVSEVK